MDFSVGDIVQMKKKHPCGSDSWRRAAKKPPSSCRRIDGGKDIRHESHHITAREAL